MRTNKIKEKKVFLEVASDMADYINNRIEYFERDAEEYYDRARNNVVQLEDESDEEYEERLHSDWSYKMGLEQEERVEALEKLLSILEKNC